MCARVHRLNTFRVVILECTGMLYADFILHNQNKDHFYLGKMRLQINSTERCSRPRLQHDHAPTLDMHVCAWCVHTLHMMSSVVQSLSHVRLSENSWTAARQASLRFTISQSLLTLVSIEPVMPSNHLILCRPLLLPSVFPSIRVFSKESVLHVRWPKELEFQLQHLSFQ